MDKKILLLMLLGWLWCMPDVAAQTTDRYAAHSVLSQGRWVKIRIPETGFYQITDSLARQAGFADAAHVSVWGYGGALQPEVLTSSYLKETDDLKPVATYYDGHGRRLFHGVGPVNWSTKGKESHVRNYYSDYGYYFLTDASEDYRCNKRYPHKIIGNDRVSEISYTEGNDRYIVGICSHDHIRYQKCCKSKDRGKNYRKSEHETHRLLKRS